MTTRFPSPERCGACREGTSLPFDIAMAFQPIVNVDTGVVFAQEALVRGAGGEGAGTVLSQVHEANRYAFDQRCRITAIEAASGLGLATGPSLLSINFLPNAVYRPEACIRLTLETAQRENLPLDRLMFEFTENESIGDPQHVKGIVQAYKAFGFKTALDDFGAGYAGLGLLADFQPDYVKLDMHLVRGVDADRARRTIVGHLVTMLQAMDVTVIAEGIETADELAALHDMGVTLMQGYWLAKPAFMAFAEPRPAWRFGRSASLEAASAGAA